MFNLKRQTMKKTYINPKLEVIKIAVTQMLADSKQAHNEEPEEYGSRGYDDFDDENVGYDNF